MKRGTIGGDVMLHTMLIRVCGLETWHETLRKLIYNGIDRLNIGDMETTDNGADASHTSRNHVEVINTYDMLVEHVNGQPIGRKEISTEYGICDIFHVKLLCEGVSLAEHKRCFLFGPCFDKCAIGSD